MKILPLPVSFFQEGKTALHLAAENGHQKALLTLLEHNCDPEAKDTVGIVDFLYSVQYANT